MNLLERLQELKKLPFDVVSIDRFTLSHIVELIETVQGLKQYADDFPECLDDGPKEIGLWDALRPFLEESI